MQNSAIENKIMYASLRLVLCKNRKLKSLSSVALEQGSAVHHLIEVSLRKLRKGNPSIDIARLENYVAAYADTLIKQRQFFDTYYKGIEVKASDISENVLTKFKVFAASEVFEGLAELVASGQTDVNKWVVESNGDKYGETRIGETKALCNRFSVSYG